MILWKNNIQVKSSIRKFLLIYLLIAITLIITLTAIVNHYLDQELYLILFTFPLSGLLIWIIVGKGLDSLEQVAQEVAHRAPSHLEPVNLKKIPQEIKPVIDELNNLFYRLKLAFEREKRFAADAAHELRTPLAAIKVQAQLALNSIDLNEKNIAIQKLLISVDRSTHIIQQLLILSKLGPEVSGINDLDLVDLAQITREVLSMLASAAVEKNIELEFEAKTTSGSIAGNSTAISILIRNIVDNAIRYTVPHGHVIVRVYQKKQDIILEVQDNGPGIPKALRARVFERFFRLLGSKSPGSGLGLSIVRQIAELYNGRVKLESPPNGSGLVVRVFFPAKNN